ncbi:MAG: CHAT domain-containing tetratricopeptide repeat protein, partial [Candidatus Eremiobacterota bacterium]
YDKAIEKIDRAIKIFEEIYKDYGGIGQFDYYLVSNYDLLGKVYQKKGDKNRAIFYMNKAIECAGKHAAFATKPSAYNYLGNFYYETKEYLKALETYKEALKGAEEIRSPSLLWEYYFSLGKTYEKLGNMKEAYNACNKSINIIENMRNEFKVEELKRDFMQDKIKVYEHMIDILIKMKKEEEAFNCNERCRSRAFLDILANQKVDIRHGVSPELVQKEEELTNRIQFLSSDIRQEKTKPVSSQRSAFIEERDSTLKKLKSEYRQLLEEIKMENPEYMTLITINPLTLEEIKSLLDKDTVIIEYFLGENNSYCWITGNNSFNTVIIDHKEHDIENLVKKYREVACDSMTPEKLKNNEWKEISEKLYTILFKDMEKHVINKKRILISPHKILHYLPFQVLSDNKGTMLVEKYDISYLPSASVLKYCQKKNTLKKEKLLAFDLGNFKADELPSLPGTEEEIKAISEYFPIKEVYSGKDMVAEILYKKGRDFDMLHLATHGILDNNSPLFSSLVFSDRSLPVYEIFDLDLRAYLVTLSACKTALSEEANGDELVGLSRAFIYAGTPTICSSLWDVSDRATSELMKSFYFHLRDKNKTEALRLAQIDIMKKYHHPFFWAPFVLTGDWR